MKQLLLALALTFSAALCSAQSTVVVLPETLQDTMSAMGDRLKTIGMNFSNPEKNQLVLAATVDLVLLTNHAQTKVPTKVLEAASEEQPVLIQRYQNLMSQTSLVSVKLLAALQNGATDSVVGLLTELKSLRKTGHDEFTEE